MARGKTTRAERAGRPAEAETQSDLFIGPQGLWFGCNSDMAFRLALGDAIAASGKSRGQIAQEMERLLGSHPDYAISEANLNAWTAPSRTEWRLPAIYLLAFIAVTGATGLFRRAAPAIGLAVAGADEQLATRYGRLAAERKKIDQELRQLEGQLGVRR